MSNKQVHTYITIVLLLNQINLQSNVIVNNFVVSLVLTIQLNKALHICNTIVWLVHNCDTIVWVVHNRDTIVWVVHNCTYNNSVGGIQ